MAVVLPFEEPIDKLLRRVDEVRTLAQEDPSLEGEVEQLLTKAAELAREVFSRLTPIQKVQVSRHAARPYTLDYVERLFDDWVELKGDRRFGDDAAIVAGLARYHGRSVAVIGHQKGRGTKDNVKRNFGMPHPEGYRKAIRLVELASRFGLPVLTFVDTPGAYPGIGAEERGQSEAIGASLAALSRAPVPVVTTIIGEGGSGGALALGVANRVLILEFGCYSVISPEGCAAILWNDAGRATEAAAQLKLTSIDLVQLAAVDAVIPEPPGGAHRDHDEAARLVDLTLSAVVDELRLMSPTELREQRYARFRAIGALAECSADAT